jgi:DNA gyrase/topoisomerase IV subunit A
MKAYTVNLDQVPLKTSNELEQLVTQLLAALRKAKLQSEPVYQLLQALERDLSDARRARFDDTHSDYAGY